MLSVTATALRLCVRESSHITLSRPTETPQRWHEPLDSRLGDAVDDIVKLAAELQPGCSGELIQCTAAPNGWPVASQRVKSHAICTS